MKLEKKKSIQQDQGCLEIEVEVEPDVFETREMPNSCGNYLMLSEVPDEILSFGEKGRMPYIVYIYLLRCRNRRNNQCFPSIATISKNTHCSVRGVKSAITFLETNKFLIINSGYKGTSNNYYFPKEWFYEYFADDYKQDKACRRRKPLSEKRETKEEKKIRELEEEVRELRQRLNYIDYDDPDF